MLNALRANLLSTPQRQAWTNLLFREPGGHKFDHYCKDSKEGYWVTRYQVQFKSLCQQGQVSCGPWWTGLVTRMLVRDMERGTRVSIPQAPEIDSFRILKAEYFDEITRCS